MRPRGAAPVVLLLLLAPTAFAGPPAAGGPRDDSPAAAFELRGVVHAAYGPVFSHEERMSLLAWMGEVGMNVYVHAPKENPYSVVSWREPYPDWMLAQFQREMALARSVGIQWAIGINPGATLIDPVATSREICFSCESDFELLAGKYKWFHDHGARILRISFDDGKGGSTHPEDALRFGVGEEAFANGSAHLANRLQARFPDTRILFVPTEYSGTQGSAYLTALGHALDPRILLVWTGPDVVSVTITAQDADAYANATSPAAGPRRQLVVTDNYPVNDYNGAGYDLGSQPRTILWDYPGGDGVPFHIHLGPLKGRGADLVGHVRGLLANPMVQPEASKLALATTAAYLNDPLAYTQEPVACAANPSETTRAGCLAEEAWLDGIRHLAGQDAQALLDLANQMRATPFDRSDSPMFVAARDAFLAALDGPLWKGPHETLRDELQREATSALRIAQGVPSRGFATELRDHLTGMGLQVAAGLLSTELLAAQRPSLEIAGVALDHEHVTVSGIVRPVDPDRVALLVARLDAAHAAAASWPFPTHGDRWQTDLNDVWVAENRMDAFVAAAQGSYAEWLPFSALAAAGPLTVTVDGAPVPVAPDGTFSAVVAAHPNVRSVEVVVTDAAGLATGEVVAITGGATDAMVQG